MSSRGKRAMEARGLPTAHLGVHLLTPQEGATGVSMLRGLYKARGARGLLPGQPRVQPSLGTYGYPAHAHAAISLVGAMHAAGVPAAVRNAWLGAAGSGSLKEIFSGLEAEAEAEAGEVSGVAEAGEPVEAEGGAGEAEEVIEAGEVELGAEAPTFDLDNDAYHDVAAVQAVSPTSSPSPKPNPIARPHQPQTQLSVLKPEPQAQPHRPTPTTPTTSTPNPTVGSQDNVGATTAGRKRNEGPDHTPPRAAEQLPAAGPAARISKKACLFPALCPAGAVAAQDAGCNRPNLAPARRACQREQRLTLTLTLTPTPTLTLTSYPTRRRLIPTQAPTLTLTLTSHADLGALPGAQPQPVPVTPPQQPHAQSLQAWLAQPHHHARARRARAPKRDTSTASP